MRIKKEDDIVIPAVVAFYAQIEGTSADTRRFLDHSSRRAFYMKQLQLFNSTTGFLSNKEIDIGNSILPSRLKVKIMISVVVRLQSKV